jgi:hypothetical protein
MEVDAINSGKVTLKARAQFLTDDLGHAPGELVLSGRTFTIVRGLGW